MTFFFFKARQFGKIFTALLIAMVLAGCLTQILLGATKEVMWRLLAPMVGLDPNATSLFEQPVIRDRMMAFLGPQYEPVLGLLKTADQLQKEGPLFYVVSRYTPMPEYAEKAGLVWDSDTNRMAVMLVTGGSPTVIAEELLKQQASKQLEQTAIGQALRWPGELQSILDADALKQQAEQKAAEAVTGAVLDAVTSVPAQQATPPPEPEKPATNTAADAPPVVPPEPAPAPQQHAIDEALDAEIKAQEAVGGP